MKNRRDFLKTAALVTLGSGLFVRQVLAGEAVPCTFNINSKGIGGKMKIISWNIDSLNAALTSDSSRALMSRAVLGTIKNEDPDIIAIQETKLPHNGPSKKHKEILAEEFGDYDYVWISSSEPARKGYAGNMTFYKKGLMPLVTFPKIGAPDTMDFEGRIATLEFEDFFFTLSVVEETFYT